jgi:HD-like signal output (HDOD) protein
MMQESNIDKILSFEKSLHKAHLPVLDNTLVMVKDKLSREQFKYEQLESSFNLDPMCLFNFLTCANQYTQKVSSDFEETIKTPKHASMLLGTDNIEKCISKLTTLKTIKNRDIANKIEQLACRSLHCAYQARHLARLMKDSAEEEIFLSALMMSLSEILVWFISPTKAQQYELLVYTKSMSENEAQHQVFGFSFVDLMLHMEPKWRLPELYIQSLKTDTLEEAKRSIICIKLADKLSRLVDFGWYYQQVDDYFDYCTLVTPFSAQRLLKEFHYTATQMSDDMLGFYKFCLPISRLVLQPGKVPYYPVLLPEVKLEPQQDITKEPKQSGSQAPPQVKPVSKLESASNLPTLIQLTISTLFETDNFDRVILIMLDKSKTEMTIRIEKTRLSDHARQKKIMISPTTNLFSLLLEKPQPIFVRLSEAQRYKNLLTNDITDALPAREFFAKAFYYKNKPIGIFYVTKEKALDNDKYAFFKKTLVRFEKHLSRL